MYLINGNYQPGQVFNYTFNNLCIGTLYEISIYLANLMNVPGILPNIKFQVCDSATGTVVLAERDTGDVPETVSMTWIKYGMSFVATTPSVVFLMISNAPGGYGNDFAVDDIVLRSCSNVGKTVCPPCSYIYDFVCVYDSLSFHVFLLCRSPISLRN
jgi:hypothetical protein